MIACVDGSSASEQVLPVALGWAAALGMSMTILTVADDDLPSIGGGAQRAHEGSAGPEGYVADLVARWDEADVDLDGVVVRDPINPANGLKLHLDDRQAGLVAVTTHARSGVQRLRFGATAASMVHASVAPCLVVPVAV